MRKPDDDFLALRYSMMSLLEPNEPTDDLHKYTIELVPLVDPDGEPGQPLGHFSVSRFNIGAYNERGEYALFDLFDDDSEEAADLYRALFDPNTEDFNREVLGEDILNSDVLYFQQATFGKDLERSPRLLAAAERIIQTLGSGCAFAALWLGDEPYPKREDYALEDVLKFWEAQRENEQFWAKIGFNRIPESLFLVRNLALRSPISIRHILENTPPEE
jgi:hypothetical protein